MTLKIVEPLQVLFHLQMNELFVGEITPTKAESKNAGGIIKVSAVRRYA